MTHDDPSLELLERDLRALVAAQPEDDRLRLLIGERLSPTPIVRRNRGASLRFALPAVAAVAAGTTAIAVALVGLGGGTGPRTADAAVLHHALAAVTAPADTILHMKTVDVQNGTQFVGEWWQQSSPPYASRSIKGTIGRVDEFGDDGTTSYFYDASTDTVYEQPDGGATTFEDPVSLIRQQLEAGQASLAGTAIVDGQSLYEIQLDGGVTAYVDEATYVPRYLDEPQRGGQVVRFHVVTYEYLPSTPANQQLLSVVAEHPGAHLDTNPGDWPAGITK